MANADTAKEVDNTRYSDIFVREQYRIAPRTLEMPLRYTQEQNVALGYQIALTRGIIGQEWSCFHDLGMRESGWDNTIYNRSGSGAFGIPQALPASKLDAYGDRHDPSVQIMWMIDYVFGRYGTFCKALNFQVKNDWY